jgi:hypothetical protein
MRSLLLCLLAAPAANAALVTYEYQGSPYTTVVQHEDSDGYWNNRWRNATQDFVTGSLTFDTDRLNLRNASYEGEWFYPEDCEDCVSPLVAWQFFDGVTENSSASAGYFFLGGYIRFTTDAEGNFLTWGFKFFGDPESLSVANRGDFRTDPMCPDDQTGYLCARSSEAGTWRKVPEPAAWMLLGIGLIAIRLLSVRPMRAGQARTSSP